MGKTARWLRGLLSRKKSPPGPTSDPKPAKEKKRWGFVKSFREKETAVGHAGEYHRRGSYREEPSSCSSPYVVDGVEQNKHAIAVAAATAAVAEAAVAAANAAAAVVRLTSSGRCAFSGGGGRKDWAAVKVQSAFRGYLARRALKALKGLVKLQALVRGHLVRKQAVDMLRYMQAIQRVQARARAGRSQILETRQPTKGPHRHPVMNADPATPEKYESGFRPSSTKHEKSSPLKRAASKSRKKEHNEMDRTHCNSNRLDQWMDERSWDLRETPTKSGIADDEKSDKILEVDTVKPHVNSNRGNTHLQQSPHCSLNSYSFTTLPDSPSKDSTTAQRSFPSPSSVEMQSLSPLIFPLTVEDTADSSPHFYSASSRPGSARRGPFTPPKSDCSRSFISGYSDYPNYMANTESSRAKVRSHSAPKQRPEFEKSSSTKRLSVQGVVDGRVTAGWGGAWTQRSSSLRSKFTSKAYPGSGRLDRLGMPIQEGMGNSDVNAGRC